MEFDHHNKMYTTEPCLLFGVKGEEKKCIAKTITRLSGISPQNPRAAFVAAKFLPAHVDGSQVCVCVEAATKGANHIRTLRAQHSPPRTAANYSKITRCSVA
jgi:hypothetical protein